METIEQPLSLVRIQDEVDAGEDQGGNQGGEGGGQQGAGGNNEAGGSNQGGGSGAQKPDDSKADIAKVCSDYPDLAEIRGKTSSIVLAEDGSNYLSWKTLMPISLQTYPGAWECSQGTLIGDKNPTTEEEKKQQLKYTRGNIAARYMLLNSIHPTILLNLFYEDADKTTASVIWKRLQDNFGKTTESQKFAAVNNFLSWRYRRDKSIQDNITSFKRLKYALEESQADLSAEIICITLINKLPPNWDWIKVNWIPRPKSEKNFNNLVSLIMSEAARRESEKPDEASAMLSKTNFRSQSFRKTTRKQQTQRHGRHEGSTNQNSIASTSSTETRKVTVTCNYCKKPGHLSKNCFAKKARSNNKKKSRANIAECLNTQLDRFRSHDPEFVEGNQSWVLDSGATHHVTNTRKWYKNFNVEEDIRNVRLGGATSLRVKGSGTIHLTVFNNGVSSTIVLNQVLYVPSMRRQLLSMSRLASENYNIKVLPHKILIMKNRKSFTAHQRNGLYIIKAQKELPAQSYQTESTMNSVSLKCAHESLAHVGIEKVKAILKQMNINYVNDFSTCEACIRGKMTKNRYPSRSPASVAKFPGTIHGDLVDIGIRSINNARYYLCLTDEFSKYRKVYQLYSKDQTAECIKRYTKWYHTLTGSQVTRVHTDGGLEFNNAEVRDHLASIGAEFTKSTAYRPQQNGLSERSNRTLNNLMRTILNSTNSPIYLWGECLNFCAQVLNSVTMHKELQKTAYELMHKRRPNLSMLHPFGTKCFYYDNEADHKLKNRGKEGRFVGALDPVSGCRIWIPGTRIIKETKDVVFPKPSIFAEEAPPEDSSIKESPKTTEESTGEAIESPEKQQEPIEDESEAVPDIDPPQQEEETEPSQKPEESESQPTPASSST
jgi:transposase InsO family protein